MSIMKKLRHPCIVQFLVRFFCCSQVTEPFCSLHSLQPALIWPGAYCCWWVTNDMGRVVDLRRATEAALLVTEPWPPCCAVQGACTKQPHLCIISAFVARGSLFRLLHRSTSPPSLERLAAPTAGAFLQRLPLV